MNLKKFLCTLSGDDYSIIIRCDDKLKNKFALIGGFVLFIFIMCFTSSYFTFTMIFENYIIGIPVSIFFSWMITNIYLLLLYTLTKNSLPHKIKPKARFFSLLIRIGFICFMAVMVSKPIESLIFSRPLHSEIATYKEEQIKLYTDSTTKYFDDQTAQLIKIIDKQKQLYGKFADDQIEGYTNLLQKKENQKYELISSMKELVNNSNYYIQGILILNYKFPLCWMLTLLVIIIFLMPAYLKNFLPMQSNYYSFKQYIETSLILQEYKLFKEDYKLLFKSKYEMEITFSESYLDAPFNTIRKTDGREFLKEDDLISELYND